MLNPADAGDDPPEEAESSSAYPESEQTEDAPFVDDIDSSDGDEETEDVEVGEGPQSIPAGTLADSEEQQNPEQEDSGASGQNGDENSGSQLRLNVLLAALCGASTAMML